VAWLQDLTSVLDVGVGTWGSVQGILNDRRAVKSLTAQPIVAPADTKPVSITVEAPRSAATGGGGYVDWTKIAIIGAIGLAAVVVLPRLLKGV